MTRFAAVAWHQVVPRMIRLHCACADVLIRAPASRMRTHVPLTTSSVFKTMIYRRMDDSYCLFRLHSTHLHSSNAMLVLWRTVLPYGYNYIKHPVTNRVKSSFVIFDIRALWLASHSRLRLFFCEYPRPACAVDYRFVLLFSCTC